MAAAAIGQKENNSIACAFSRAAKSYDRNACAQRQSIAISTPRLAEWISSLPPGDILEVGCGTGLFSEQLACLLPGADITFIDPAQDMLKECRQRLANLRERIGTASKFHFACMSAEQLNNAVSLEKNGRKKYALIASSFALQWISDLPETVDSLLGLLKPGGVFFFCLPTEDSFPEWKAACHESRSSFTGNKLPAVPEFLSLLDGKGGLDFYTDEVAVRYPSALQFFRALRSIGATVQLQHHNVPAIHSTSYRAGSTISGMRRMLKSWKKDHNGEVTVTYNILYGALRIPHTADGTQEALRDV